MTTAEQTTGAILERLILALVDHPQDAELEAITLPSRINWRLRVNINDAGKVIGKKGAHVIALKLLIAKMGDRLGQVWDLKVIDPEEGRREVSAARLVPVSGHHSPTADAAMLDDLLEAVTGNTYAIAANATGAADFTFTITPNDWPAHEALVDKAAGTEETLIAAIGTLYRAVGRRQGVGYAVEVAK